MSPKYVLSSVLLALVILFAGCSSANRTAITGSWDNPDHPVESFDKILIIGISDNTSARAVVEQTVADELAAEGFNVGTASQEFTDALRDELRNDRELADRHLAERGYDGVMVIALLDIKEDTYYVPGTVSYQPMSYYPHYGGYYGYWGTTYTSVYNPGYYENSLSVFLESNLYAVENDVLIWSAQSRTEDPSSVQGLADHFARVLVDEMLKNDVISPTSS